MKVATKEELSLTPIKAELETLNTELGLLIKNDYSSVAFRKSQSFVCWLISEIQSRLAEEKFSTGFNDEEERTATTHSFYSIVAIMTLFADLPRLRQELQFFLAEPLATELAQRAEVSAEDYRKCPEALITLIDKALSLKPLLLNIQAIYKPITERIMRFYANNGNREGVDNLLMGGVDVNSQGAAEGKTAMHQLTKVGLAKPEMGATILVTLCMQQADINLRSLKKRTALHEFCEGGAIELIDELLTFQPDPTLVDADGNVASALLQKCIDAEKNPKRKEALTNVKRRLESYQSYREKFLAAQETRRALLEVYSLETLFRIGKAFIQLELSSIGKTDIYTTYVELGLAVLHYCQDENSTVLSSVAAQYLYESVEQGANKKTRESCELDNPKCEEAHGEFIMRFIFGDERKRLRHFCTILIIALSAQVEDPLNNFPCVDRSYTDKYFQKVEDSKTTIDELKAMQQTLLDKHLELTRPYKLKEILNIHPHQHWLLRNLTERLSFQERVSAIRCIFVTQECPHLVKVFKELPKPALLTYEEHSCGLTTVDVLYTGETITQLDTVLDLQNAPKRAVKAIQVNGSRASAMKILKESTLASKEENYHSALVLCQHVCHMDPENPMGFVALAEAYEGMKRKLGMRAFEPCVEAYNKALTLTGPLSTTYIKLALLFIERVQEICMEDPILASHPMLNEALILAQKANAIREIPGALKIMADIYRLQGKVDEAKLHYEKCLQTFKGTGYNELDLLSLGQHTEATQQLAALNAQPATVASPGQ